jgi:hypothetical protein
MILNDNHRNFLTRLTVGGCTCMTKTPELKYHADDCQYRMATEIELGFDNPTCQDVIEVLGKYARDTQRPLSETLQGLGAIIDEAQAWYTGTHQQIRIEG